MEAHPIHPVQRRTAVKETLHTSQVCRHPMICNHPKIAAYRNVENLRILCLLTGRFIEAITFLGWLQWWNDQFGKQRSEVSIRYLWSLSWAEFTICWSTYWLDGRFDRPAGRLQLALSSIPTSNDLHRVSMSGSRLPSSCPSFGSPTKPIGTPSTKVSATIGHDYPRWSILIAIINHDKPVCHHSHYSPYQPSLSKININQSSL